MQNLAKRRPVRLATIFSVVTVMLIFGLVFQNCDAPPPGLGSSGLGFAEKLPFGYQTRIDRIAYMSCDNMGPVQARSNDYFSFQVMAKNEGSGLRLVDELLKELQYFSPEEKQALISKSPRNSNLELQLAVRPTTDFQRVLQVDGKEGFDYDNIMGPLDTPATTNALLGGQFVRTFSGSGAFGAEQSIVGKLRFLEYFGTPESVVNTLDATTQLRYLLTLTYRPIDGPAVSAHAEDPDGVPANAWGTGYSVKFTDTETFSGKKRIATSNADQSSVREYDLATGTLSGAKWTCRSLFIEPRKASCADASGSGEYGVIREILGPNWTINLASGCVGAPSENESCYGSSFTRSHNVVRASTCTKGVNCPHFFSYCYRQ